MNAVKKPDLKSELEDILLPDDDSESGVIIASSPMVTQKPEFKEAKPKISQQTKPESTLRTEHLSMAQEHINALHLEIDHLRSENERLSVSNESFKITLETINEKLTSLEKRKRDEIEKLTYERNAARDKGNSKEKETLELRSKVEELENRLQFDLKKIRVRERELQNRLELVKVEGSAILRNKDEMILDLKRQIDVLGQEVESAKHRGQVLAGKNDLADDRMKRSVKALRLALSLLEGEEATNTLLKKVD